jgi:hypothetical protein
MFIYNVTVKVDWSIHEAWLIWMKEEQIPAMLLTKHFNSYQMVRLLEVDEDEGPTYAIQYYAASMEAYQQFIHYAAPDFSANAMRKWGDRFVLFGTLMEVVN